MTIEIKNESGRTAYLLFSGNNLGITPGSTGTLADGASSTFDLTSVSAGRLHVSLDKALNSSTPDFMNPNDPDYTTRFDKIELSYNSGGAANLTSVDFYAIPFSLQSFIKDSSTQEEITIQQNTLKSGGTGNDLETALISVISDEDKARIKDANGNLLRILSPVKVPGGYESMQSYVDAVVKAAYSFTIKGTYFGNPSESYDYSGTVSSDHIKLSMTGKEDITILTSNLADDIYTCNGAYYLGKDMNTAHYVAENDFYAAVYRDVMAGFNFGYMNGSAGTDSEGWWNSAPFSAANSYYNKYASEITQNYPGAYGFPFSDRKRNVLMDLGGEVNKLKLTILSDTTAETPVSLPGVLNPQTTGSNGATFNVALIFANNHPGSQISFGGNQAEVGYVNNYLTGPQNSTGTSNNATIAGVTAQEGWNKYEMVFETRRYTVIAKVENGTVVQSTIAGGGNASFTGGVLYLGGLD